MRQINLKIAILTALFTCFPLSIVKADISVVTTIKPLHSIVSSIMRGVGEPNLLLRSNASPHDFKLKPSHVQMLNKADVVFWFGPMLESRMVKSIGIAQKSARVITLLKSSKIIFLPSRSRDSEHGHGHGLTDPHIWLSMVNAKTIAFIAKNALATIDPRNSNSYTMNYNKFVKTLDQLKSDIRPRLTPLKDIPFMVHHDSFQYFENEFQLNNKGAVMISAEQRPGAKRLSELRKRVKKYNITCIFSEPHYSQKILHSIANGSPTKIVLIDSIGAGLKPGPSLFGNLLKNISSSMQNCLRRKT